jgi:dihydroorotate dehydrogenase electron transfer subunit
VSDAPGHPHRGTIFVEQGEILAHQAHPGAQYVLRVQAPRAARTAQPGSFAHVRCDPALPMRRPLSLMRADAEAGWLELLYKVVGAGTELLARRQPGERLDLMAPIGTPFVPDPARPRPLLLGGGVGLPPMIFLADRLRRLAGFRPVAFLGSEVPFPFPARPSRILLPQVPDGVIACMPLLDDWGVPSRLASLQGYPGCHDGYVTDLARRWLDALDPEQRAQVELFACGGGAGARLRPAGAAVAGGVHGLRRRRLRRLRGGDHHPGGAGDETGLCRRAGVPGGQRGGVSRPDRLMARC